MRRLIKYVLGLGVLAILIAGFVTCEGSDTSGACAKPNTKEQQLLDQARKDSSINLLYPCTLPASETLQSSATTGPAGRQRTELVFNGPYDMTVRQSQYPPAVSADPAGASRTRLDLFPNVQADFVQINDGSQKATYHLFWVRNAIYYELQAFGPPLQQRQVIDVARSLQ